MAGTRKMRVSSDTETSSSPSRKRSRKEKIADTVAVEQSTRVLRPRPALTNQDANSSRRRKTTPSPPPVESDEDYHSDEEEVVGKQGRSNRVIKPLLPKRRGNAVSNSPLQKLRSNAVAKPPLPKQQSNAVINSPLPKHQSNVVSNSPLPVEEDADISDSDIASDVFWSDSENESDNESAAASEPETTVKRGKKPKSKANTGKFGADKKREKKRPGMAKRGNPLSLVPPEGDGDLLDRDPDVHRFCERANGILTKIFAEHEAAINPSAQSVDGSGFHSMVLAAMTEMLAVSSQEEIKAQVLRGFPTAVKRIMGCRKLDEFPKAILSRADEIDHAHYAGLYLGLCTRNGKTALYAGMSTVTVRNRVKNHQHAISKGSKESFFYQTAVRPNCQTEFRVMALYPDETLPLILVLGETVIIEYLGTIAPWTPPAHDKQSLYRKLRDHINQRVPGGHCNITLPLGEKRGFGPCSVPCSNCGDSNPLRREHGLDKITITGAETPEKALCGPCNAYDSRTGGSRPVTLWSHYLMPGKPACHNCHDDEPLNLTLKHGHHLLSFDQAYQCIPCAKWVEMKHKESETERPEDRWLPHLRRSFMCQLCGLAEGSTTGNAVEVRIGYQNRKCVKRIACETCYGPPYGPAGKERRKAIGWTYDQAKTHRSKEFWLKPIKYDGYGDGKAGKAPVSTSEPWHWYQKGQERARQ